MTNSLNFGTCWGTPSGQDVSTPAYWASGFQVVGEAVARRWTTSPGQVIDDPDYGYNLNDLISDDLTPTDISYAQQKATVEALKDERVLTASVTINLSVAGQLTVTAFIGTAAGPFKLVLTISQVNPTILLVSP